VNVAVGAHVSKHARNVDRGAQDARVKPVGQHLAGAMHQAVEPAGDADGEPLHASRQRGLARRFGNEVHMVTLKREFTDAHSEPVRPCRERRPKNAEAPPAT